MVKYNWCIDAGNSSIKWGFFLDNVLVEVIQFHEDPTPAQCDECRVKYPPEKIGVSSVRGPLLWLHELEVQWFSSQTISPFVIDYNDPLEMGADRCAAALGAYFKCPNQEAVLVVDVGTCITYTAIKNEVISGLAISPGLRMRWKAMHHFTAQLPLMDHGQIISDKGTYGNLWNGGVLGWRQEIAGMIDLFCEREQVKQVVITGSDVVHLEKHFKDRFLVIECLNLWGLNYWLNEN